MKDKIEKKKKRFRIFVLMLLVFVFLLCLPLSACKDKKVETDNEKPQIGEPLPGWN